MKWLHFILSHSIFIAVCAVAMVFQTVMVLQLKVDVWVLAFVFVATLFSYNSYWLLSKKIFGSVFYQMLFLKKEQYKIILLLLYFTALLICYSYTNLSFKSVYPAICLNLLYALPLLPFKVFKFAKRLGFLKTALLAFTWMYVTGFLPLQKTLNTVTGFEFSLLLNRFLFMFLLCAIFDIRDVHVDKIKGLHNIATNLKAPSIKLILFISWMLLIFSIFLLQSFGLNLNLAVALIISALAIGYACYLSLQKQGYLFYYFFVDGMMLFSAFATYIASI